MSWNPSLVNEVFLLSLSLSSQTILSDTTKHGARITSETPVTLKATPKAQWLLQK